MCLCIYFDLLTNELSRSLTMENNDSFINCYSADYHNLEATTDAYLHEYHIT